MFKALPVGIGCIAVMAMSFSALQAEEKWYERVAEEILGEDEQTQVESSRRPTASRDSSAQGWTGQVLGFERMSAGSGPPEAVQLRVRDEAGKEMLVQLGAAASLDDWLTIGRGDRVKVLGRTIQTAGQRYFHAREIQPYRENFHSEGERGDRILRGRVEGLQQMAIRGRELGPVVLRITTDDGWIQDVLIGSAADLRRGESLRPGAWVELNGSMTSSGKRRVLVARTVEPIEPPDRVYGVERQGTSRSDEGQWLKIRGEVEEVMRLRTEGGHRLLRVEFEDGYTQTLDLGPRGLGGAEIRPGSEVVIEGRMAREHGTDVLLVDRIRIDDQRYQPAASQEHRRWWRSWD